MYSPTQQRLTLSDDISSDGESSRVILTLPDLPVDGYSDLSPTKKARKAPSRLPKARVKRQRKAPPESTKLILPDAGTDTQQTSSNLGDKTRTMQETDALTQQADVHLEASSGGAEYECFLHLALSGAIGFVQLSETVFVVQGWDSRTWGGTDRWFHLEKRLIGEELAITCYCPHKGLSACFHSVFVRHQEKELRELLDNYEAIVPMDLTGKPCVIFSRQPLGSGVYIDYISVGTPGQRAIKSRVVVRHEGAGTRGVWKCSKDGNMECAHVARARKYLQELGVEQNEIIEIGDNTWINAENSEVSSGTDSYPMPRPRTYRMESVSYLPVLPPIWASLPSDTPHYPRTAPASTLPEVITLDRDAGCPQEGGRANFQPSAPIVERRAILYGLTCATAVKIQLQRCTHCSLGRRQVYMGPETRKFGVFNFNNRALFLHHLLDDYTSAYTGSETPFAAWVRTVSQRYEAHFSGESFVSEEVFRAAWFAYVTLQDFKNDMTCIQCGPAPEDTIWDGVTLAFHEKHLQESLKPPTTIEDESPEHKARYIGKQEPIPDKRLRRDLREFIRFVQHSGSGLRKSKEVGEGKKGEVSDLVSGSESDSDTSEEVGIAEGIEENIHLLSQGLHESSKELAEGFLAVYGTCQGKVSPVSPAYYRLFLQLAGDDPWYMVVNRPALQELGRFNRESTWQNATRLVLIPCLYETLEHHHVRDSTVAFPQWILGLCRWIEQQSARSLQERLIGCPRPISSTPNVAQADWRKSGCYYSLPPIRRRPKYPQLRHDINPEKSIKRGKCSKFYSQYGKNKLTGGIIMNDNRWVYLLPQDMTYGKDEVTSGVYPEPQFCIGGDSFTPLPLNFECRNEGMAQECLEMAQPVADAISLLSDQTERHIENFLESSEDWKALCAQMDGTANCFYAVTLGRYVGIYTSREQASRSLRRAKQNRFCRCYSFRTFHGAYIGLLTHMGTKYDFIGDVTADLLSMDYRNRYETPLRPSNSARTTPLTPSLPRSNHPSSTPSLPRSNRPSSTPSAPRFNHPPATPSSSRLNNPSSTSRSPPISLPSRNPLSAELRSYRTISATPSGSHANQTIITAPISRDDQTESPPAYSRLPSITSEVDTVTLEMAQTFVLSTPTRPRSIGAQVNLNDDASHSNRPEGSDSGIAHGSSSPSSLFDLYVSEHGHSALIAAKVRRLYENSTNRSLTEFRDNLRARGLHIGYGMAQFYYAILKAPPLPE